MIGILLQRKSTGSTRWYGAIGDIGSMIIMLLVSFRFCCWFLLDYITRKHVYEIAKIKQEDEIWQMTKTSVTSS